MSAFQFQMAADQFLSLDAGTTQNSMQGSQKSTCFSASDLHRLKTLLYLV